MFTDGMLTQSLLYLNLIKLNLLNQFCLSNIFIFYFYFHSTTNISNINHFHMKVKIICFNDNTKIICFNDNPFILWLAIFSWDDDPSREPLTPFPQLCSQFYKYFFLVLHFYQKKSFIFISDKFLTNLFPNNF